MKHFQEFIIRIQTFEIHHKIKNSSADNQTSATPIIINYDISHENPHLFQDFNNELKRLTELAITDLLNLSEDQMRLQVKRLEQLKTLFQNFWKRYYSVSRFSDDDNKIAFYNLELQKDFIVRGILPESTNVIINDQFLDDLGDSIQIKEDVVKKLEEAIHKVVTTNEKTEITWTNKYDTERGMPSFKSPETVEEFYNIIQAYFINEDREQLANLLQTNHSETGLLLFNGFGNQLADAFKQLLDANLIVGCSPGELEKWIQKYFLYRDKGKAKQFTEKYLKDIISSNTKLCQSPILDVKRKEDGQFGIVPIQRIRKNYKK